MNQENYLLLLKFVRQIAEAGCEQPCTCLACCASSLLIKVGEN